MPEWSTSSRRRLRSNPRPNTILETLSLGAPEYMGRFRPFGSAMVVEVGGHVCEYGKPYHENDYRHSRRPVFPGTASCSRRRYDLPRPNGAGPSIGFERAAKQTQETSPPPHGWRTWSN